jgi:hypothetical protein
MKFKLSTAGHWYRDKGKEELEKLGFKFDKADTRDSRFGEWTIEYDSDVSIEIGTLEELMKFISKWGSLILHNYDDVNREIVIYDDYVE